MAPVAKYVRFADHLEVRETLSLESYTPEEIAAVWYDDKFYEIAELKRLRLALFGEEYLHDDAFSLSLHESIIPMWNTKDIYESAMETIKNTAQLLSIRDVDYSDDAAYYKSDYGHRNDYNIHYSAARDLDFCKGAGESSTPFYYADDTVMAIYDVMDEQDTTNGKQQQDASLVAEVYIEFSEQCNTLVKNICPEKETREGGTFVGGLHHLDKKCLSQNNATDDFFTHNKVGRRKKKVLRENNPFGTKRKIQDSIHWMAEAAKAFAHDCMPKNWNFFCNSSGPLLGGCLSNERSYCHVILH